MKNEDETGDGDGDEDGDGDKRSRGGKKGTERMRMKRYVCGCVYVCIYG